jgi:chemotaxis response regulator CheB
MNDAPEPWFVAIGGSGAQGLADIKDMVAQLPATLPAVVLVVLHRPAQKTSNLCNVLAHASGLPVAIAAEGERFECGRIYIGKPAEHLQLAARSLCRLAADDPADHRNRTVDLLFTSVARHARGRMIGVVLSGSLDDGSRGLAAIGYAGGLTMVLAPSAREYAGMPDNAAAFDGTVDLCGSVADIAHAVIRAVGNGAAWPGDFHRN